MIRFSLRGLLFVSTPWAITPAVAQLPVPCGAGTCGATGPVAWVTSGQAGAALAGNKLTVEQLTEAATLNWASFNVDAGHTVAFQQPSESSVALNRIFQADAVKIFGSLQANGRVFLLNQNGILFGEGARVDVGGLIASTLDMSPAALERGFARAFEANEPAFQLYANGQESKELTVAAGAELTAADGGQILLFAPEIENHGRIHAAEGQAMLAAGERVYLLANTDQNLRGFLVQVDHAGTVSNGSADGAEIAAAIIDAPRGNVTLAGLTVNQNGRLSATTAVQQNGSIHLRAQEGVIQFSGGTGLAFPTRNGELTLGANSRTEVLPEIDNPERTVDATVQPASSIVLEGERIELRAGATVRAPSGDVELVARTNPVLTPELFADPSPTSRIVIGAGASIDVSGLEIELPVERNVIDVELRGNQLRDSPVQRDGPLRGKKVSVDIRERGVRADGTPWQGTPLADASGEISTIQRTVAERSLTGGTVELASQGAVVVVEGASIDVSGGRIDYQPGMIETSRLLGADGRVYDVSQADPDRSYTGIVSSFTREHRRWGVTEVFPGFASQDVGRVEPGYVEGKNAGALAVIAPQAVLDGTVRAEAVRGPYQRFPGEGDATFFDTIPSAGTLRIGSATGVAGAGGFPNYVARQITIGGGLVLPGLGGYDPFSEALPVELTEIRLRAGLIDEARFGRLELYANDEFLLPSGFALNLPVAGELQVVAGRAALLGDVVAPGGVIGVTSRPTVMTSVEDSGTTLGADATLSVAGLWTNDSQLLNPGGPTAPVVLGGGEVDISVELGRLDAQAGSAIDVSGGAWRDAHGDLVGGPGGLVAFAASPGAGIENAINLGTSLAGFGLTEGGTVRLAFPAICIECAAEENGIALGRDWFTLGGFAHRELDAESSLLLADDAQIEPRQLNLLPTEGSQPGHSIELVPSGTPLLDFMRPTLLPEYLRRAADLDLQAVGSLRLGQGSRIVLDARARLGLTAGVQIIVDGTIDAPSGDLELHVTPGGIPDDFDASQGIWLGEHADLKLAGTLLATPNNLGIRTGEVLDGGSLVCVADRGYIVTALGSRIDVSGAAAELDVLSRVQQLQSYAPTMIGSAAGSIDLTAAEGMLLGGVLRGAPGTAGTRGGRLSVTVDPANRADPGGSESVFPLGDRRIVVRQGLETLVVGTGRNVPADLNGQARLSADTIAAGEFDTLSLAARSLFRTDDFGSLTLASTGEIAFEDGVRLALRRSVNLDAAMITGNDHAVSVAAPYVTIGNLDRRFQHVATELVAGAATFEIDADLIDLVGAVNVSGFGATVLRAEDLRLNGLQAPGARHLAGVLQVPGSLTIEAVQVYPTTLSEYRLQVHDTLQGPGTLSVQRAGGGDGAPVLSAAGSLTLAASTIRQGGVLRAPFGRIELDATDLVLAGSGVTSTSGAGLLIPFGTVQAGADWVYELGDQQTLVFNDSFPSQNITLNADNIDFRTGAVVDLTGGGDLQAYEFIPGIGGSRDVLAAAVSPATFAVLPSQRVPFAPHDAALSAGSALGVGDTVFLEAFGELPRGEYVLLPARYALLPGAYLVTAVDGYTDIRPGEQFARLDGSTIVAGRRGVARTGILDARTSGFAVLRGSDVLRDAEYRSSSATAFLDARPESADVTRLPRDAGALTVLAREQLALAGTLAALPAERGRGAQVDFASARLRLVNGSAPATTAGEVVIDAAGLSALGAESVLLGGTRTPTVDGTRITTTTESVVFDAASVSRAPELLVAARDRITVSPGAVIEAQGNVSNAAFDYLLEGDGAFLRVSTGSEASVERSPSAGATGTLAVAAGARVAASGSMALDTSLATLLDGELDMQGALFLGASQITLGVAGSPVGLRLSAAQLAALGLTDLTLTSRSTIDFATDLEIDVPGRLSLDANALLARDSVAARLSASTIMIEGAGQGSSAPSLQPIASLLLSASDELQVAAGGLVASGWADVHLQSRVLRAVGDGALATDGDLRLTAANITAASGVDYAFQAAGRLQIGASLVLAPPTGAPEEELPLGASLRFVGGSVENSGRVQLASGAATFVATIGDVVLADTATLDLAGRSVVFDGVPVAAPGGTVRLAAERGNVFVAGGAIVDVSGGEGGDGGRLELLAPNAIADLGGQIRGTTGSGGRGSALYVDGHAINPLHVLAAKAQDGGFFSELVLRQRGPGDLVLPGEFGLSARTIAVTADGGSILLGGSVDTRDAEHGRVVLSARDAVQVFGTIDSGAAIGGDVELRAQTGGITLGPSAAIDISGDSGVGGRVRFRAPLAGVTSVSLLGTIDGAAEKSLELFTAFDDLDGVLDVEVTADSTNPLFAAAADVIVQRDLLRTQVGRGDDPSFMVIPGLEIRSPESLRLGADWNLADWRFDGFAGVLTLRATGDLLFDRTLSDGFLGIEGTSRFTQLTGSSSWSYRLTAGADLASADPLAVLPTAVLAPNTGNLVIAPGTVAPPTGTSDFRMIRTGTGDIEIATARNVVLGNRASTIYTAGRATDGTRITGLSRLPYPDDGGDLRITAQGDIVGAASNQLVTDWLWRVGRPSTAITPTPTAWTVAFQRFEQNVGALGGGDVTIRAGGDISNFSAVVPSVGRQLGSAAAPLLEVVAGGNLEVSAGRDIRNGSFFVGRGSGTVRAGRSIGPDGDSGVVLALSDGDLSVQARRDLTIETALNPTLLPQGLGQRTNAASFSYFSTYSPRAGVALQSTAGNVSMSNDFSGTGWLRRQMTSMAFPTPAIALGVYPPTLRATALRGDVEVRGSFGMFPATKGNLELFANDSLRIESPVTIQVLMSDSDPELLPSVRTPSTEVGPTSALARAFQVTTDPILHATTPIHAAAAQPDGVPDSSPVRLIARNGDILFQAAAADSSVMYVPKPVRAVAGRDIRDLSIVVQHNDPADNTTLHAARDVVYSTQRAVSGTLNVTDRRIEVAGGGRAQVLAGRNVDLGSSSGIATTGDLLNPALADAGADVSILAGLGDRGLDVVSFVLDYLETADEYRDELVAYLEGVTGASQVPANAVAVFNGLPLAQQLPFLEFVFVEELKISGRAAAQPGPTNADFSRGFEAIDTLFPGANPDVDAGEINAFSGDVRLFFSRVYTLDGGDISIFAPGGAVNAGLATPPAAFGITKPPSQLGIVAQRDGDIHVFAYSDFLVNESRVFAADGGNILVWSTRGDIDAGRGAKTAISAPPPIITIDDKGNLQAEFPPALTGSGIQTLATSEGRKPGNVDLFAPRGVVNAGDAGIVAGNLTIAATAVLGADNISVSGVSVGVPVDTGGFAAALTGVSSVASSASNAAEDTVTATREEQQNDTPLAEAALGFLDVFVTGFGDGSGNDQEQDDCAPGEANCRAQ